MSKQFLGAADVNLDADGNIGFTYEPYTAITGGNKVVASTATPEAIATTSTCRGVWVGVPCDADGGTVNTKVCYVGGSATQLIPLLTDSFGGVFIKIDDPSKVFIDIGANGESVNYMIFA